MAAHARGNLNRRALKRKVIKKKKRTGGKGVPPEKRPQKDASLPKRSDRGRPSKGKKEDARKKKKKKKQIGGGRIPHMQKKLTATDAKWTLNNKKRGGTIRGGETASQWGSGST